jgi:hypothetical protein
VKKYSGKGKPPNQTVVNAFIISRVPISSPITYSSLNINLLKDIEQAKEKGFNFFKFSRRATAECMLRFLIDRKLLSHTGGDNGQVRRTERAEAYMRKLPKRIINMLDKLPMWDPLILLAGSAE